MTPGLVLGVLAVVIASAGSATAATLITGAQVEDESLTGEDIRDGSVYAADLNRGTRASLRGANGKAGKPGATGATGKTGATGRNGDDGNDGKDGADGSDGADGAAGLAGADGAQGATGPQGPAGNDATFSRLPWGIVGRNTIGSPVAYPRVGPNGRPAGANAATILPPYGQGSLGIHVEGVNGTSSTAEKLYFADETSFANLKLADLTNLSFWVYSGEDAYSGHALPSIAMEANPDANGATYTTLQYTPDGSSAPSQPAGRTVNSWQFYDALASGNKWTTSASLDAGNTCKASACSFSTLLGLLGPNAKVTLSLGFNKGRDNEWTGAVDGLRVNDWVYDFEPEGVVRRTP